MLVCCLSRFQKEICSLELQLEESQTENRHIKEINADLKTRLDSAESKFLTAVKAGKHDHQNGETHDIGTILKLSTRLQDMINYNNDLKEENNALKKVCSMHFEYCRLASKKNDM